MPLVGAMVIPTAPLLVPGMSTTLPNGVAEVRRAMNAALSCLEHAECVLLVAAGEPGIYEHAEANLAGFGRPDLTVHLRTTTWPTALPHQHGPLPPSLAVLALLVGDCVPLVPASVDARASADDLATSGAAFATSTGERLILIVAGDLSAGLDEHSPRYRIEGAAAWDNAVVEAVEAQQPERLAALGPAEACRVVALGWAPIVVAQAACVASGLRLRATHYSAPRGVGYLIATTYA